MGYFANGTEGAAFEETWCVHCVHYDEAIGEDPPCPVWMAHLLYSYDLCSKKDDPGKVILDLLIEPTTFTASDGIAAFGNECKMFHSKSGATPGQMRFEGT